MKKAFILHELYSIRILSAFIVSCRMSRFGMCFESDIEYFQCQELNLAKLAPQKHYQFIHVMFASSDINPGTYKFRSELDLYKSENKICNFFKVGLQEAFCVKLLESITIKSCNIYFIDNTESVCSQTN